MSKLMILGIADILIRRKKNITHGHDCNLFVMFSHGYYYDRGLKKLRKIKNKDNYFGVGDTV